MPGSANHVPAGLQIERDLLKHPSLASPFEPHPSWANVALLQPLVLFHQAVLAFDAGADWGTALLCRSALEAACYVFLTRRKMEGQGREMAFWSDPPLGLDGKVRRVDFEEVRAGVIARQVLSPDGARDLKRIRDQGNIIAHLASRSDKHLLLPLDERLRSPLWVNRQQALEDLRDTASIFKTLADSMASVVPEPGATDESA